MGLANLLAKLGYKKDVPALLWQVPETLRNPLDGVAEGEAPRFLLAFVRDAAELVEAAREIVPLYPRGGHLWIAYPKKSGRIKSDITRDKGWEPIAALGLLGVTQVALDEDWSALRFRYRDEIRKLTRASERADS